MSAVYFDNSMIAFYSICFCKILNFFRYHENASLQGEKLFWDGKYVTILS